MEIKITDTSRNRLAQNFGVVILIDNFFFLHLNFIFPCDKLGTEFTSFEKRGKQCFGQQQLILLPSALLHVIPASFKISTLGGSKKAMVCCAQ